MHRPNRFVGWRAAPTVLALWSCGGSPPPLVENARSFAAPFEWRDAPPLPAPVTNNAVAAAHVDGRDYVFSFLGLGPGRDYRAIVRSAYVLDVTAGSWTALSDVPGEVGRLAAVAQAFEDRVFLFGGYAVAADGTETTSPAVDVLDVRARTWSSGAPIPVPVDDQVAGLWRNRLIYMVSGWSNKASVADVQAYDPREDTWIAATPTPGRPVFGHAGGIAGDTIVYCDGAVPPPPGGPKFVATNECYRGDIDPADPSSIAWTAIDPHPGRPHYRMAAAGVTLGERRGVLFVGGTDNPYNYNGIGYDSRPSEPDRNAWFYDIDARVWMDGPAPSVATMDHRGLAESAAGWYLVGGMTSGQIVTARVARLVPMPGR